MTQRVHLQIACLRASPMILLLTCASALAETPLAPCRQPPDPMGGWIEAVHRATRDSTVTVESAGAAANGFFAGGSRLVVTTYGVVRRGRSVTVRARRGVLASNARVLVVDPTHDLAVLQVDVALRPLPLETSAQQFLGEQVVVVGRAFDGQRSAAVGAVSAIAPEWLQVALPHGPSAVGAPVISPAGCVLGMVGNVGRDRSSMKVVRAVAIAQLLTRVDSPAFTPAWSWVSTAGLSTFVDARWQTREFGFGTSAFARDRFGVGGRFSFSFSANELRTGSDAYLSRSLQRFHVDADASYRILLSRASLDYLVIGLVGGLAIDIVSTERLSVRPADPDCILASQDCDLVASITTDASHAIDIKPGVRLGYLARGVLELSSALYISPANEPTVLWMLYAGIGRF